MREQEHAPFAWLVDGGGPGRNRVQRPRRPTLGLLSAPKDLLMEFFCAARASHHLLHKTPLSLSLKR